MKPLRHSSHRLFQPSAFRLSGFFAAAFSLQAFSLFLPAAEVIWDGSDGNWNSAAWSSGFAPVASDTASIASGRVTLAGGDTGAFSVLRVGADAGLSGTLAVNGILQGSSTNSVGIDGTGVLEIGANGIVSNTLGYIGVNAGGSGTVVVAGLWQSNGNFYVGNSGNGFLEIRPSGTVTNTYGRLGQIAGGSGTAIVFGLWQNTTELAIGMGGSGYLKIEQSGTVTNTNANVAYNATTSSGTAIVAGLWRNTGELNIGRGSAGYLKIEQNGTVTNTGIARLGYDGGGNGTAIVAGYWQSGSYLHVGSSGIGCLEILPTGTMFNSTLSYIGNGVTSSGTVIVSGSGLWQHTGDLYVGNSGKGYLEIQASGTVINAFGRLGQVAGGSGTAFVSGLWQNNTELAVGMNGAGFLKIEGSGTVTNTNASVGYQTGSSGTAIVAGFWRSTGELNIGRGSAGYLKIEQNGIVTNTGIARLGFNAGISGTAIVAGYWQSGSYFNIGSSGNGYLEILPTGTVFNSTLSYIGNAGGSSGTAVVSGSGLWQHTGDLYVGNGGTGYLEIQASGTVINAFGRLGQVAGGSGTAFVSGLWQNNTELAVGMNGAGFLKIEQSGTVTVTNYTRIGYQTGSRGTAIVAGFWQNNNFYVSDNGSGFLEILPSGTVASATAYLGGANATASGTAFVAGLWRNTGAFTFGRASPGYLGILPTGTVTVGGNFLTSNASSVLAIELQPGRTTPYLAISGNAVIGGSLTLVGLAGGGMVTSGTKASDFAGNNTLIIRANGGIVGNFSTIDAPGSASLGYIIFSGYAQDSGYYVGYGIAWNAATDVAHGAFDIPAGDTFDVDVSLDNRTGITSGWDGRSLTKNGAGTLILSAENSFTGPLTVNAGAIRLNGGASVRLGALHLNGGEIDFGGPSDLVLGGPPGVLITPAYDGYRTLAATSLDGTGDFHMKLDLTAGKSDRLVIDGDATGAFRLLLHPAPGAMPVGDEPQLTLVTVGGLNSAQFTSDATFTGGYDYGPFNYVLEQRNNEVVIVNNGFCTAFTPIRGVPGAQSIMWFSQQDSLGRRLGELRALSFSGAENRTLKTENSFWTRARASQSNLDATGDMQASRLNLWGVELGADRTWTFADDRLTLGLFAGYGSGSQDFTHDIAGATASGGSDLLGAGLYGLWLNNNGWFASLTLSAARYKNNFDVGDQSGNLTAADYNDTGYGVTVELGKRFTLPTQGRAVSPKPPSLPPTENRKLKTENSGGGEAAAWFIEPAVQFSRILLERADYLTRGTSPLGVHNANANITRLRGVVRAGRAWQTAGSGVIELAGRLAFVREASSGGEVRIGAETWRPNLDGNRGEAGAGLIWRFLENCQIHIDYSAAYGDNYKKPWDISLGLRLIF